jgi:hypothetical protein
VTHLDRPTCRLCARAPKCWYGCLDPTEDNIVAALVRWAHGRRYSDLGLSCDDLREMGRFAGRYQPQYYDPNSSFERALTNLGARRHFVARVIRRWRVKRRGRVPA